MRLVMREAEAVFKWRDGALVPKHGATDPVDPMRPVVSRSMAGRASGDGALSIHGDGAQALGGHHNVG